MHWFWRTTISIVIGNVVVAALFGNVVVGALYRLCFQAGVPGMPGLPRGLMLWPRSMVYLALISPLASSALSLATYIYLTRRYGPQAMLERETRCRKCGYILRGIPEPRCSECGEKI